MDHIQGWLLTFEMESHYQQLVMGHAQLSFQKVGSYHPRLFQGYQMPIPFLLTKKVWESQAVHRWRRDY
jgi:hypothetical protein